MGSNKSYRYKSINALLDLPLHLKNSQWNGKNNLFHPEGHQCLTKFSLNYVTYGKDSFEIVLTPPEGLQNASWIILSQIEYRVGVKGLRTSFFTEHVQRLLPTDLGFQPATLLKNRLWQICFSLSFEKLLRIFFDKTIPDDCLLYLFVSFGKFFKKSL